MKDSPGAHPELARLIAIIDQLRSPGGCPWDREQTEQSMAPHLLEESYEAIEAIELGRAAPIREELGDVLMNVLMIARIAAEGARFDLEDIARTIADKLVRRHPHVFGDVEAKTSAKVLQNWEAIKQQERRQTASPPGALAGVPVALPALLKALRIGEKAARLGFDWPQASGPRRKLDEELAELDRALAAGDAGAVADELGDVLFSIVNVARHAGINPEMALRGSVDRFVARFTHIESALGERLQEATLEEMESLWEQAKAIERRSAERSAAQRTTTAHAGAVERPKAAGDGADGGAVR